MNTRKKLVIFYIIPLILLIAVSVVYAILTHNAVSEGEELISCFFKESFHLYCPGCGGSRSLLALLRLDIVGSFILFPALSVSVIILICLYIRVFISFLKNDEKYIMGFHLNSLIIIPVIIILNFIIRNILLLFFGIDLIGDFY